MQCPAINANSGTTSLCVTEKQLKNSEMNFTGLYHKNITVSKMNALATLLNKLILPFFFFFLPIPSYGQYMYGKVVGGSWHNFPSLLVIKLTYTV